MRTRAFVLVGLFLVAAAAWFLLRDAGGGRTDDLARGGTASDAERLRTPEDAPDDPTLVGRGDATADGTALGAGSAAAVGKVVDPGGVGVPGIEVVALRLPWRERQPSQAEQGLRRVFRALPESLPVVARTTTDAEGRFRLQGLTAGRRHRFQAHAPSPWAWAVREPYAPAPYAGTILLRVRPGGSLRIRVVDAAGKGVRAAVDVWTQRPWGALFKGRLTDGDGRIAIQGVPRGAVRVYAWVPGRGGRMLLVTVPTAEEVLLPLADAVGASVAGRVLAPDGSPIADAKVVAGVTPSDLAAGTWSLLGTRSAADGTYRIEGFPPGRLRDVSAAAAGHLPAQHRAGMAAIAAGSTHEVDLTLRPGCRIEGHAIDSHGAALAGVRVLARGDRNTVEGLSDASGRFVLDPLAPGSVHVTARKPGWYLPAQEGGKVTGEVAQRLRVFVNRPASELVLVLRKGVDMVGRCADPAARPLAGVTVWAVVPRARGIQSALSRVWTESPVTATSNADGTFRLAGLPIGTWWRIEAAGAGHRGTLEEIGPLEGGLPLDLGTLRLERAVRVSGRVLDTRGAPVAGLGVTCQSQEHVDVTAADGAFALDGLRAGSTHVWVRDGNAELAKFRLEGLTWGEHREGLVIEVPVRLPLAGRLVDAEGAPQPYLMVELKSVEGATAPMLQAFADAEGRFALDVWGEGPYRAFLGSTEIPGRVTPGAGEVRLVIPEPLPPLTVRVVDDTGTAIPRARVTTHQRTPDGGTLSWPRAVVGGVLELEPGARANLERIVVDEPAGEDHRPLALQPATVTVTPEQREVTVVLLSGLRIAGRVCDENGAPVRGVSIQAVAAGDVQDRKVAGTRSDGQFAFEGLRAGRWRLSFSARDPWLPAGSAWVEAGAEDVELRLHRGAPFVVEVRGSDGAPVRHAYVALETTWAGRDLERSTGTEEGGRCTFFVPKTATYAITVRPDATADSPYPTTRLRDVPYADGSLVVQLVTGVFVEGDVVTPEGEPVRTGIVRAESLQNERLAAVKLDGQRNTFRLGPVPRGRVRVIAKGGRSMSPSAPREVDAPARGLVLRLRRQVLIEGRIVDAGDGSWALQWLTGEMGWSTVLKPDKTFRFAPVYPVRGTLYLWESEGTRYVLLEDVDPETTSFEVTPKVGRPVAGRVEGDGAAYVAAERGMISRSAGVDEDGAFEIRGVPEGAWTLIVYGSDHRVLTTRENVPAGTTDLAIALD